MRVSKKELALLRKLVGKPRNLPEVVTTNWNCQGSCSSGCSGSCWGSCQTGCITGCQGSCWNGCQSSCRYACQDGGARQSRW